MKNPLPNPDIPEFVLANLRLLPATLSKLGYTQRQFASLCNVDSSILSAYTRQTKWPSRSYYNRIARVCGWQMWKKGDDAAYGTN